ncbi:hypothetical protein BG000_011724 [Podila horticola]|nr:hypothetical protein BG000_011724 [Podila horticola]
MQRTLRGWARNDFQSEILAQFGLCLANSHTDTKGQVLYSHNPKPTVDYSEFFAIARQHHWYTVELEPFIRLIKIPEELRDMSVSETENTLRDKDSLTWIRDCPEAMKNLQLFHRQGLNYTRSAAGTCLSLQRSSLTWRWTTVSDWERLTNVHFCETCTYRLAESPASRNSRITQTSPWPPYGICPSCESYTSTALLP